MISQQSLYPHAGCNWVGAAHRAVHWCKEHRHTIVTSIGVPTRNLVTALCGIENVQSELILPPQIDNSREAVLGDFGLAESITNVIELHPPAGRSKELLLHAIDVALNERADILIPISIRTNGFLMRTLEKVDVSAKQIIREFEVPYQRSRPNPGYRLNPEQLSKRLENPGESWLIHWTRTNHGPWPNETQAEYYRDIIASTEFPRSAMATLCRMLQTRQIIASANHIAGLEPVVAFSSLHPREAVPLMRWRARYRQMSFEPYGVGIRIPSALQVGIQQVIYYDAQEKGSIDSLDKWLTQSVGKKSDWRSESEYRHRGNLDLRLIPKSDLCVFTRTKPESDIITKRFALESRWFID